jgi:single-strand DNA-binding protein
MYQKITIVGYLGNDPEMRYTPSGQAVTNFNVATSRKYTTSDGNEIKETAWFRVSSWGKSAEFLNQSLKKGNRVLVDGRLRPDPETGGPRTYTRQDGTTGANYEINAFQVLLLFSREEGEYDVQAVDSQRVSDSEDIPF